MPAQAVQIGARGHLAAAVPLRREVARVAIDRLVEDGRIHPARIEEVVQRVNEEVEELIQQAGTEAAYGLGISDYQSLRQLPEDSSRSIRVSRPCTISRR